MWGTGGLAWLEHCAFEGNGDVLVWPEYHTILIRDLHLKVVDGGLLSNLE